MLSKSMFQQHQRRCVRPATCGQVGHCRGQYHVGLDHGVCVHEDAMPSFPICVHTIWKTRRWRNEVMTLDTNMLGNLGAPGASGVGICHPMRLSLRDHRETVALSVLPLSSYSALRWSSTKGASRADALSACSRLQTLHSETGLSVSPLRGFSLTSKLNLKQVRRYRAVRNCIMSKASVSDVYVMGSSCSNSRGRSSLTSGAGQGPFVLAISSARFQVLGACSTYGQYQ